jgi:hypothetical protein
VGIIITQKSKVKTGERGMWRAVYSSPSMGEVRVRVK